MINLIKSLNKFGFETLQKINARNDTQNAISSPYSAFVSATMSAPLFENQTRKEILNFLQVKETETKENIIFKQLRKLIDKENSDKVLNSNTTWASEDLNFDTETLIPNSKLFGISIEKTEFPQPACDKINEKISELTKGMITNLITPSDFELDTSIFLSSV